MLNKTYARESYYLSKNLSFHFLCCVIRVLRKFSGEVVWSTFSECACPYFRVREIFWPGGAVLLPAAPPLLPWRGSLMKNQCWQIQSNHHSFHLPFSPQASTNNNNHFKAFSWETWACLEGKSIVLRTAIIVRINHRYLKLLYHTIITNIYAASTAAGDCTALLLFPQNGEAEWNNKWNHRTEMTGWGDAIPPVGQRRIKQPLPVHVTTPHAELHVFPLKEKKLKSIWKDTN